MFLQNLKMENGKVYGNIIYWIYFILFLLLISCKTQYTFQKEGDKNLYNSKFDYIVTDSADLYFIAKAYKLLEQQDDNSVSYMLYHLEPENVYTLPVPPGIECDTEPALVCQQEPGYEYTIAWIYKNKTYRMDISNRFKSYNHDLHFKGLTLSITEENEKYTLTKRARVSTAIGMLDLDFLDFVEKPDTNAYVLEIKKCDSPCKSIKIRQSHPFVESFIKYRDKQKSQQDFSITISNYFCWGNRPVSIVVPQTVETDGNKKSANTYLFQNKINKLSYENFREVEYEKKRDFEKLESDIFWISKQLTIGCSFIPQ